MDLYESLGADHKRQEELANAIVRTRGDGPERRDLFEQFQHEVKHHIEEGEDEVFSLERSLIQEAEQQDLASV